MKLKKLLLLSLFLSIFMSFAVAEPIYEYLCRGNSGYFYYNYTNNTYSTVLLLWDDKHAQLLGDGIEAKNRNVNFSVYQEVDGSSFFFQKEEDEDEYEITGQRYKIYLNMSPKHYGKKVVFIFCIEGNGNREKIVKDHTVSVYQATQNIEVKVNHADSIYGYISRY